MIYLDNRQNKIQVDEKLESILKKIIDFSFKE